MKIGVIQENFLVGDFAGNAQKIVQAILKILEEQSEVDFFITPEMSLWGYPPQDLLYIAEAVDECLQTLTELCTKLSQVCFLVGLATKCKETNGKTLYNSMALCANGKVEKLFHKCLLPNYDVFDDTRYFAPGNKCQYFELKDKKIGVGICEDLCYKKTYNFAQDYTREHLDNFIGLDLIVNPSASPYSKGKITARKENLTQISKKLGCPILFVNQVGGNDSLVFDGSSFLTSECGVLGSMPSFRTRARIFSLKQGSRAKPMPMPLEITEALTLGIKDYFKKTRFKKAVLGLSGGVDSALTLFLAVRALGKDNVTSILLPSPYSSEHSITDAEGLAKNLGVEYHTIFIKQIMEAFSQSLDLLFKNTVADETEENIQTRIRGTILMAIANKTNQLLLSTGNKSEIFTGYCTLYGDMCGSLNPLGDLKKTEVYAICRYFQKQENIFPPNILNKAPSAELKKNQIDQDKLPPYELLDEVLEKIVVKNQRKQLLKKQFSPATIEQINSLFQVSEYKRKQAPLIIKVSDKAFGLGWRMPLARKW